MLIDAVYKLQGVNTDIKKHPRGNSVYADIAIDYIQKAQEKIRTLAYGIMNDEIKTTQVQVGPFTMGVIQPEAEDEENEE